MNIQGCGYIALASLINLSNIKAEKIRFVKHKQMLVYADNCPRLFIDTISSLNFVKIIFNDFY